MKTLLITNLLSPLPLQVRSGSDFGWSLSRPLGMCAMADRGQRVSSLDRAPTIHNFGDCGSPLDPKALNPEVHNL